MMSLIPGLAACLFYLASLATQLIGLHESARRSRMLRLSMGLAAPALVLLTASLDPDVFTA